MKAEKRFGSEAAIRKLIDDWASAVRAKDLDTLMLYCAAHVVFFMG
jgi:ketosteroid isomerase-like protein